MDGRGWKGFGSLEVEEVALYVGALQLAGMARVEVFGECAYVVQVGPDGLGFIFALSQFALDYTIEQ